MQHWDSSDTDTDASSTCQRFAHSLASLDLRTALHTRSTFSQATKELTILVAQTYTLCDRHQQQLVEQLCQDAVQQQCTAPVVTAHSTKIVTKHGPTDAAVDDDDDAAVDEDDDDDKVLVGMDTLPWEILDHVFTHLDFPTLCTFACVSRTWHDAIRHSPHWLSRARGALMGSPWCACQLGAVADDPQAMWNMFYKDIVPVFHRDAAHTAAEQHLCALGAGRMIVQGHMMWLGPHSPHRINARLCYNPGCRVPHAAIPCAIAVTAQEVVQWLQGEGPFGTDMDSSDDTDDETGQHTTTACRCGLGCAPGDAAVHVRTAALREGHCDAPSCFVCTRLAQRRLLA